ncbi:MAG: HAD family hydrolase [Roseburia sp.]|nr:HAD family hydrolase [Roseburia sp.]
MKYENYIFDLYGTLVDIHTDEEDEKLWEALADFYGAHGATYTAKEIQADYLADVAERLDVSEEIRVEDVFRQLFAAKDVAADNALVFETCRFFRDTSTEYVRLYPWSLPILEKLKAEGKGIYLLSNAQRSFTEHELDVLGLTKYFDVIMISSDCGIKKPNLMFFKMLMKRCGLKAKECLFVGNDEICDIFGAKKVGMDTFYIHSNCSPEYTGKAKATYTVMDALETGVVELP